MKYFPGERAWSVFWGLCLGSETVIGRVRLSYGGGVDGGRGMWWVWCMALWGKGVSPHRLDGEMAESSGWTRGVNSTGGVFCGGAKAELDDIGELLVADADTVLAVVLM